MSTTATMLKRIVRRLQGEKGLDAMAAQVAPLPPGQIPELPPLHAADPHTAVGQSKRLEQVRQATGQALPHLSGETPFTDHALLRGNIENYIGMAMVPVGIAGPLLVRGTEAQGAFMVPLATTEGALVASYSRGMKAITASGGATVLCLTEGVQRSPVFRFGTLHEAGRFLGWIADQEERFTSIVSEHSRHARLLDVQPHLEGNTVILTFEFATGDASGQNMVTICTNAICQWIMAGTPIAPHAWYVESNYSGDKKATSLNFTRVRGRKVTAEVRVPEAVVKGVLKTSAEAMADYWRTSTLAVVQSGAIGAQGHVANGLAALFIACGQDAACVAECATGITRMEAMSDGGLYVALTLPNLMVGTVGGGTGLPTQRECLAIMDCVGAGKARKLAEITCATALAGEISIAAALSAGHFSDAHRELGRK